MQNEIDFILSYFETQNKIHISSFEKQTNLYTFDIKNKIDFSSFEKKKSLYLWQLNKLQKQKIILIFSFCEKQKKHISTKISAKIRQTKSNKKKHITKKTFSAKIRLEAFFVKKYLK